jgi:hypothetical protein
MKTISIAIPTYQRVEMTINAFSSVHDDKRISEIIIVDDSSPVNVFDELKRQCDRYPKVKLYWNVMNRDCYANKYTAMSYVTNEYAILFDSDNKLRTDYIDKIFSVEWDEDIILAPDFAKPTFDYRAYGGLMVTRNNVAEYMDRPLFETALNTANYFVNAKKYTETWDGEIDPVTSDSIYFNLCWLMSGKKIHIVDGLQYEHLVWDESHYKRNVHRTPQGFHQSIIQTLKRL